MEVGAWLRGLGLGQYEAVFHDHRIDEQVLPHLTAEDLREMGVATVGDRRKLLAAIAALTMPTLSEDVSASSTQSALLKYPEDKAERRPITVMFCDLVGSTSLAANSMQKTCATSLARTSTRRRKRWPRSVDMS